MDTEEQASVIKQLIERANSVQQLEGSPFVIVPDGYTLEDLSKKLAVPPRKTGNPTFTRSESLLIYAKRHWQDESSLYVVNATQIVVVFDPHNIKSAGWGQHRATLNLMAGQEWKTWKAMNEQFMPQRNFAQFIEDNSDDVAIPSGADLLDLIRTIKASQNLECTGEVNEKNEDKSGGFVIATRTKAGVKGELELPNEFTLRINPYEGGDKLAVRARLRFSFNGASLALKYELVQIEKIEKQALEAVVLDITDQLETDPMFGTP